MTRPRTPIGAHGVIAVCRTAGGLWRARTYYRFPDGRSRQVERVRPTRAGSVAALKEALVSASTPSTGELRPSTRIRVLAEQFLVRKADARLAPRSLELYRSTIEGIITPRLGDLRIDEATTGRLQAFFIAVAVEHGPGAAKSCRTVMSGMFGLAVRADACRTNPIAGIERIRKGPSQAATALPPTAVADFIASVRSDPELIRQDLGDLLAFMVLTGCRMGEALGLRWSHVDLAAAKVTFDGTVVRLPGQGLLLQDHGKTAASTRTISVADQVVKILAGRP